MSAVESAEPWIPADTWGSRLAQVRQRMGWNIAEAAEACELSAESWRKWEKLGSQPRRREEAAAAISRATGCSYVWLMAGSRTGSR